MQKRLALFLAVLLSPPGSARWPPRTRRRLGGRAASGGRQRAASHRHEIQPPERPRGDSVRGRPASRWSPSTSATTSGPANEAAGRTGFAHLFEHMMFQQQQARAARTPTSSSSRPPARATSTAPPTSTAPTISRRCPSSQLELALWLESDRMGYLLDTLDRASAREPAGRRPQRAAPDAREHAVRHSPRRR